MPRPRLTDEEIATMRERILDAAVAILHEEGPAGLSIRAIADRVGVSHMVLYTYFENRDALHAALHDRQRRMIRARHADDLARARTGDVTVVIREVLVGYVTFACHNPRVLRFLWGAILHDSENRQHPSYEGIRKEVDHLATLIRIGIERGEFVERDPTIAAVVVSSMINGSLVMSSAPGMFGAGMLDRIETEVIDTAMAYLTGQKSRI